jgi:hypothetical protein
MLELDLRGQHYTKAQFRREVEARIDRTKGSVEYKLQNVTAVLVGMGRPWIIGYKPASQFQDSLIDAVLRWFQAHPDWDASAHRLRQTAAKLGMGETTPLWIDPPPTHRNTLPPVEPEKLQVVASRFNAAEADERNRSLGLAGEERVLLHERANLAGAGQDGLARRVRWVSRDEDDGAGYDIASFEPNGRPRLIEVKTTNGWERTPFHITRNELAAADEHRDCWVLFRLWNFAREPRAFEIRPPLDRYVELTPTSFLAALR